MEDFHWCRDVIEESEWGKPSAYVGRVLLLLQTPPHCFFQRDVSLFVRGKDLKLVSDMPDSNRNWKNRYCAMRKNGRRCLVATLTIHGLLSKSQVEPISRSFAYFILMLLIPSPFSCL